MLDVASVSYVSTSVASPYNTHKAMVLVDYRRAALSTHDIALQLEHIVVRGFANISPVDGRQILLTLRHYIFTSSILGRIAYSCQFFLLRYQCTLVHSCLCSVIITLAIVTLRLNVMVYPDMMANKMHRDEIWYSHFYPEP